MRAANRPVGTWRYIPPEDAKLPADQQTTFILRPLTQRQRMEAWDNLNWTKEDASGEGGLTFHPRAFQLALEMCLTNIEAIENFPVGEPKSWPESKIERQRYLEQFDDFDILLVGNAIRNHAVVETETKNSSPPTPTST